jgi:hypothetical protein
LANKTNLFKVLENNIAAGVTDMDLGPIIANGKIAVIKSFGGAIPFNSDGSFIAIQWGDNTGGWNTIRVIVKEAEYTINREFQGNGVKRFRLVRKNTNPSTQPMIAWLEGFVHDAS